MQAFVENELGNIKQQVKEELMADIFSTHGVSTLSPRPLS